MTLTHYRFVEWDAKHLHASEAEVKKLINEDYLLLIIDGHGYTKDMIKEVRWGHRGQTIVYHDGLYDWAYRVDGYWIKVTE